MKVARIYFRVSSAEQDLTRQAVIEESTRAAGFYIAGIYKEEAPRKHYSGKFNLRVPSDLHERLAAQAAAHGKSINTWVLSMLQDQSNPHTY